MSKGSSIKDALTKNIGLKIVAVIVGAIIWLAIVNTSDPSRTVTVHNIPISIINQKSVTKKGLVYDITSRQEVDVTISGKRSVVSNLTSDDFEATASLKELSMVNSVPVTVVLKDRETRRKVDIISQSVKTVSVNINKVKKEEYPVEVQFEGDSKEGYVPKIESMEFNTVLVKASEVAHKKIEKVVVKCNVDGADKDFSKTCKLKFEDKDGNIIKPKHAKLYKKKVKVNVHMSPEKEVLIGYKPKGKVKKGYKYVVELSPDRVNLVGDAKKLEKIKQLKITDTIDITGMSRDIELEVNLDQYVEEGLTIDGDHVVKVKINFSKK